MGKRFSNLFLGFHIHKMIVALCSIEMSHAPRRGTNPLKAAKSTLPYNWGGFYHVLGKRSALAKSRTNRHFAVFETLAIIV